MFSSPVCVSGDQVTVGEGSHPENVKVYGPGVEKLGLKANEPTYFTVDCSEAGQGTSRPVLLALTRLLGVVFAVSDQTSDL